MRRALFVFASLLLASGAAGQNALIDTPAFRLYDDGGLVSLSIFGTGTIPATGVGARLMWHPRKAAFRAGMVGGPEWDDTNVGSFSVAMGAGTTASGSVSTAMGSNTVASGNLSTAMGQGTQASGNWSTAMGQDTQASGLYATAMGQGTQAIGDWSVAMGEGTAATGDRAIASGLDTIASGTYAATFGRETWASGILAIALGRNTVAQAFASLVLGRYNLVTGTTDNWISSEPVLVVGNGSGPAAADRSNALTLRKNGNLTIAGTLTQNSDRRLKRDLRPLTDALNGLDRLQAVRFHFREEMNRPDGEHIGLVAQEVQAVFPELVSEGSDGYLSVSYTNLVAVLVQALNEQQTEIEALHARLVRLEALLAGTAAATSTDR